MGRQDQSEEKRHHNSIDHSFNSRSGIKTHFVKFEINGDLIHMPRQMLEPRSYIPNDHSDWLIAKGDLGINRQSHDKRMVPICPLALIRTRLLTS